MIHPTFVSMSHNIWGDNRLPERKQALASLLTLRDPDILSVQELRPASRDLIDGVLTGHRRVDDVLPGWACESNVWWRDSMFELEEYGAEDIGHREEHRRLFWVRLRFREVSDAPRLFYGTAHLTYQSHPQEKLDNINPRVDQAKRIVAELDRLATDCACILTADLNDVARPVWVFRDSGFGDPFSSLGVHAPITVPVVPQPIPGRGWDVERSIPKVLDWQFFRGPLKARMGEVPDFFYEGQPPSDHKPVLATFTLAY
jgi:hypothetical protein